MNARGNSAGVSGNSESSPAPESVRASGANPATTRAVDAAVDAVDPVEVALAKALEGAAAACKWDVVTHLARELEARRLARRDQ